MISNFRAIIFPGCLFVTLIDIVSFIMATIPITIVLGLSPESFWTKGENMPTPRSELGSAILGDKIYVIGGQSVNGTFRTNEKYDTRTNTWTTEPSLPTPRLGLRAAATNNTIYVFGGQGPTHGMINSYVEIFHVLDQP